MRARGMRSALIAAAVCGITTLGAGGASADGSQNVEKMVDSFSRCVQREGSADVLILLDQSASLSAPYTDSQGKDRQATDPQDLRIEAAEDLVGQLKGLPDGSGSDAKVRIAIAGFDGNYHAGDWTVLDDSSIGTVKDQVRAVGEKDDGRETDYVNALDGARSELAKSNTCRMLVFFTDGEYDVDGSYGAKDYSDAKDWAKVEQDGRDLLCSPKKGPLNALRASGVYVAGVGLSGDGDSGRLGFLRDMIATSQCGQGEVQQKWADNWAFLDVGNARDLIFALGQIGGGDPLPPEVTKSDGRSVIAFGLDPVITRVSVLADAADERLMMKLVAPDGQTVATSTDPGSDTRDDVTTDVSSIGASTTRFRLTPEDGDDLAGKWKVKFEPKKGESVGPGVLTRISVDLKSDLRAAWIDPQQQLVSGEGTRIRVQVVKAGSAVSAADLPKANISLDFRDASGAVTNLVPAKAVSEWEQGQDVSFTTNGAPLPTGGGKLAFNLDVEMTTEPVTKLMPQVTSADVTLISPPHYPTVNAAPLTLKGEKAEVAVGLDPSVGSVPVTGPGCVWLQQDATQIDGLPQGIDDGQAKVESAANSADNCVQLEDGKSGALGLKAIPDVPGYGALTGSVVVVAAPAGGVGEPIKVTVPFSAERAKPINERIRIGLLVVALLLGLGVPALILFAIRAATAKIPVSDPEAGDLHYVLKTARRSGDSVEPITLSRQELRRVHDGSVASVKQVDVEGVLVKAVPFGNPFTVAHVRAQRAGTALVSDLSAGASKDGSARLPLGLAGHWLAWYESGEVRVLYFFSDNDIRSGDLSELVSRLTESLDSQWHLLDAAASAAVPVGASATQNRADVTDNGWRDDSPPPAGGSAASGSDDSWSSDTHDSWTPDTGDSWNPGNDASDNSNTWDNDWDSGPESKDTW